MTVKFLMAGLGLGHLNMKYLILASVTLIPRVKPLVVGPAAFSLASHSVTAIRNDPTQTICSVV
jgi:hypothetical protein